MSPRSKWLSRKFWAGIVGAVAPYVVQAATDALGWHTAAILSTVALVGYVLSETATDVANAPKGQS